MQATDIAKNTSYLDVDFSKATECTPCLKQYMESGKKVQAGTVLQLVSICNISVPTRSNEESRISYDSSRHCLKATLTDGAFSVSSYIFEGHPTISDQTPPGTKLKLLRDIPFKSKALVLSRENVENLGGNVKQLVETWRVNKDLDRSYHVWGAPIAKLQDSADSGPPRWRPFDFKQGPIKLPVFQDPKAKAKATVKEEEEKTSEFDLQRKANISKLTEKLGDLQVHKTFGEGKQLIRKDVADIMKEGFTEEVAESALQRFKTVKNALKHLQPENGSDDHKANPKPASSAKKPSAKLLEQYDYLDDDTAESRAEYERQKYNSGGRTLFDFVQTAVPVAARTEPSSNQGRADTEYRDSNRGRGRDGFASYRGSYDGTGHDYGRGRGSRDRDGFTRDNNDDYHHDSGRGFPRGRGRGGSQRRGRGGGGGGRGGGGGSRSFYRSRGSAL